MRKILVVNGPNLNLLGEREPDVYGNQTLEELNSRLDELAKDLDLQLVFFQSNSEGDLIDFIQSQGRDALGMIFESRRVHALQPGPEGCYQRGKRRDRRSPLVQHLCS